MKYVKEAALIFAVTMAGEAMNVFLPFPVPAGVYGLFLLLLLLCTGLLKLEQVEKTGNFLLDIMPLLFIPASVGVMESYGQLRAVLVPVLAICAVSTVVVMIVSGKTAEFMIRMGSRRSADADKQKKGGANK